MDRDRELAKWLVAEARENRIKEVPERARAPDTIFPEAGLAFVNTERDRIAQRCAEIQLVEALVVEPVATFVDATEEAGL